MERVKFLRYISLIFVIIVLVGTLWSFVDVRIVFEKGAAMIRGGGMGYMIISMIVFVFLSILSSLLSFVSSIALIPVAIGVFGSWFTICLLMIGWVTGGILTYWIGWHASHPLVKHFSSIKKFNSWRGDLSPATDGLLAFLFRFGTPSETGYLFGIIRYPFQRYLGITFLAELPYAIVAVFASEAFVDQEIWQFVSLVLFFVVIMLSAGYILRRKIKRYSVK